MAKLSVIIPTLNEENYVGSLSFDIAAQTKAGEALVEGRRLMSREVVAYQPDTLRSRVVLFEKASHHPGELPTATAPAR